MPPFIGCACWVTSGYLLAPTSIPKHHRLLFFPFTPHIKRGLHSARIPNITNPVNQESGARSGSGTGSGIWGPELGLADCLAHFFLCRRALSSCRGSVAIWSASLRQFANHRHRQIVCVEGQMQSLPRAAGPGSHGGLRRRGGTISALSSLSRGGRWAVVW